MADPIEREGILEIIPHRYENVLLDRMVRGEVDGLPNGQGYLRLEAGDAEARDIFLVKDVDGSDTYYPFMFMEFFALGSIILMEDKIKAGLTAVFSSIRKVAIEKLMPGGTEIVSDITLKSVSSGFHRFAGTIGAEDTPACRLEIMAYGVDFSAAPEADSASLKRIAVPDVGLNDAIAPDLFPYKDPALVFADEVVRFDADARSLTTRYTYPESHPFTKGHFPGNPVMMGITQVIMLSDAAELLAGRMAMASGDISASGELIREDGAVVCEVKGLALEFRGAGRLPVFKAVKSVGFRGMVRPGETLFCNVRLA